MTSRKFSGPARPVGQPEAGFFLIRLVRGGPQVPARICHEADLWWAVVNGHEYSRHVDPARAPQVFSIWHSGEIIDQATYDHRLKLKAWAEIHAPEHPAAKPRQRIDRTKTPIII